VEIGQRPERNCLLRSRPRARFLRAFRPCEGGALRARLLQIASGGLALDLAILAEGLIAVSALRPPGRLLKLVAMMRDAGAGLVCCKRCSVTRTPSPARGPDAGRASRCLTKFSRTPAPSATAAPVTLSPSNTVRHHLHVRALPAKRKAWIAYRRQPRPHVVVHHRASRSTDGAAQCARSCFFTTRHFASLHRWILMLSCLFPDQCPYAFDGPDETRRRNPERSSRLFFSTSVAARTHAHAHRGECS